MSHLDTLNDLLEGEGHSTTNDERVDLVKHVLNELDLVGNFGTAENSKEGTFGVFKGLGKVFELLLHEETSSTLGELHADHT